LDTVITFSEAYARGCVCVAEPSAVALLAGQLSSQISCYKSDWKPKPVIILLVACNMAVIEFITARRYASAVLAVVVCPSVCLSVCHKAGIVSKRQHIESRKQRRTVAQGI